MHRGRFYRSLTADTGPITLAVPHPDKWRFQINNRESEPLVQTPGPLVGFNNREFRREVARLRLFDNALKQGGADATALAIGQQLYLMDEERVGPGLEEQPANPTPVDLRNRYRAGGEAPLEVVA